MLPVQVKRERQEAVKGKQAVVQAAEDQAAVSFLAGNHLYRCQEELSKDLTLEVDRRQGHADELNARLQAAGGVPLSFQAYQAQLQRGERTDGRNEAMLLL